ncbi:MAG: hypothetical protein JKX69_10565 [Rhodobacteraceae bacterium]|nr:hypothetical protein [Paracoccaceae bacterium]
MNRIILTTLIFTGLSAQPSFAVSTADAMASAVSSGVCGARGVETATVTAQGVLTVVCAQDATAFLPLVGGLGQTFGLGAAALLAGSVNSAGAPSDTQ